MTTTSILENSVPQPVTFATIIAEPGGSPQTTRESDAKLPHPKQVNVIAAIEVGDVGTPESVDSSNPLNAVHAAIGNVGARDLLDLAHEILGLPSTDSEGEPRSQRQAEIIVLIVDYFSHYLRESDFGALVINGAPHLYGGTHWHQLEEKAFEAMLGKFAENLGHHVAISKHYAFRAQLLKQSHSALAEITVERPPGCSLINFLNGTLEIDSSGEALRDFDKGDHLTYQLPFGYDETAQCPLFDRYIARVLPDPTSRAVLAEFAGWIFLKELKLEKVLVLFGEGHNGKSVFFDVMCALLGGAQRLQHQPLRTFENGKPLPASGRALELRLGNQRALRCRPVQKAR